MAKSGVLVGRLRAMFFFGESKGSPRRSRLMGVDWGLSPIGWAAPVVHPVRERQKYVVDYCTDSSCSVGAGTGDLVYNRRIHSHSAGHRDCDGAGEFD